MNPQGNLGGDHKGTQIQRCFSTGFRYPVLIYFHQLAQRLNKLLFRQLRHSQAFSRVDKPLGIMVGTESGNGIIGLTIGLDAFKDCLPVVEYVAGRFHCHRPVRSYLSIVPALFFGPINGDHVVRKMLAKAGVGENFAQFLRRRGVIGPSNRVIKHAHNLLLYL